MFSNWIKWKKLTNQIVTRKRIGVIDFLKGLAIISVVIDHCAMTLYTNPNIQKLSFFSVTLFVFLSGITAYLSMETKNIRTYDPDFVIKRISKILIPYIVATGISLIFMHHFFDFGVFLSTLLRFNALAPYYFILFFIQLITVSPVLFLLIKRIQKQKNPLPFYFISIIVIIFLSWVFTKYTFVMDIYGGGRMILGGSYFLVFYFGLLFASFNVKINSTRQAVIHCTVFCGLLIVFIIMYGKQNSLILVLAKMISLWQLNPPGMILLVYSALVFGAFGSLYYLCEYTSPKFLVKILKPIEVCGKYSLIIFLYHLLFKALGIQIAGQSQLLMENIFFYRSFLLFFMIGLPVLSDFLIANLITLFRKTWKESASNTVC